MFAEASKFVIVWPKESFALSVSGAVKATPSVCGLVSEKSKWSSAAATTVTDGDPELSGVRLPPEVAFC